MDNIETMSSGDVLLHVLKELESEDIYKFLQEKKIRRIRRLLSLNKDDLYSYVEDQTSPLERADSRMILQFK